jgi:type I restriction enzyme S subunit
MGIPMATSQDFVNWVCGPELDSRYLHYLLMSEQESIRRFAYGTTHQTVYYPEAKAFHVCVPGRSAQDGTVEILEALDDRIAVNERVASLCLDLALSYGRNLTESAAGPSVLLGNHVQIAKGASYRSTDLGFGSGSDQLVTLKCAGRDGRFQDAGLRDYNGEYKQPQVVASGDIVVAQTDLTQRAEVIGRPVRIPQRSKSGNLIASLDLVIVRPGPLLSREALLAILSTQAFHDHAMAYCNGTTVLHMGARAVPEYEFHLPSEDAVRAVSSMMSPLLQKHDGVLAENRSLIELRDALLPKLMSGEIRVRDAEQTVERAM